MSQNLTQEHSGNTLFKHVEALIAGKFVNLSVILRIWQNLELVIEGTPFSINDHVSDTLSLQLLSHLGRKLLDILELLVVSTVGSRSEDAS
ncbi:hypothetical protein OGATHE_004743 [Ogataea polymorpha]|uniref:Uncharacterized protein n=1 Tax=Ogataea polymorpha TaxID=460523 RepID=A0A9P8P0W6_9ASCO|nr:hypothetical protein OGATHE_004743 [Ogataea polymorpha]